MLTVRAFHRVADVRELLGGVLADVPQRTSRVHPPPPPMTGWLAGWLAKLGNVWGKAGETPRWGMPRPMGFRNTPRNPPSPLSLSPAFANRSQRSRDRLAEVLQA